MRKNYLYKDTVDPRHRKGYKPLTEKVSTHKAGTGIRTSRDDFLQQFPLFTLNEYGDRVISGRRIC
ncbi:MAG: hypothetical protein LBB83_04890 [Treponema sp.]|nr:hypothetical protein [Treponema sp.]